MLPFSDACERNKYAILEVLRGAFARPAHVLEIGSGTGQHAVHFSAALPHLIWHPTEQLANLEHLSARISAEGGANVRPPTVLEVTQSLWPLKTVDAIFTANTLHIMSWDEVLGLFDGVGAVLAPGGVLSIYGPFRYDGAYTSNSNHRFDAFLQDRDPASGLRDMRELLPLAAQYGLQLKADHDLPAFNRLLVFLKEPL